MNAGFKQIADDVMVLYVNSRTKADACLACICYEQDKNRPSVNLFDICDYVIIGGSLIKSRSVDPKSMIGAPENYIDSNIATDCVEIKLS